MSPVKTLMNSKERIKKTLRFDKPDRVGVYDIFLDETINSWRSQGLPSKGSIQDYFGHDFQCVDLEEPQSEHIDDDKFIILAVSDPFSQVCKQLGLEETLSRMACEPNRIIKMFGKVTADLLSQASSIIEGAKKFDGVWLYSDLAYDRGLFFSVDNYKKMLLPLHREICSFFHSEDIEVIFHSHGDTRELIPSLLDMGIRALEPLETVSGMDVFELRREYKKDLVLFGNISFDKLRLSKEAFRDEVEKKISFLKRDGGYIYRMDKDITPDITLGDYTYAMDLVKRYGSY